MTNSRLVPFAIVAVGALYFFLPLVATFEFSLSMLRGIWSFEAYRVVFDDPRFRETFVFSVVAALATIVLGALLVVPTAYWVRLKFPRLRPLVEFITLLPLVIPPIVLVFGYLRLYNSSSFLPFTGSALGSRAEAALLQRLQEPVLDLCQGAHSVHAPITGRPLGMALDVILIESDQGFGLLVVDMQAVAYRVLAVVGTLCEGLPGNIVDAGITRRIVLQVIDPAGRFVHAAAAETLDDDVVVDMDLDHSIDLDVGVLHRLRLGNGAGKTVEQESFPAIRRGDALPHQGNDQIIGNQPSGGHDVLGLHAQLGAGADRGAQHVTGGDLRNVETRADELGLSALACARRPQQNDTHRKISATSATHPCAAQ